MSSSVNAPEAKGLKSFEEREEEYEKARARIFNQLPPTGIQTSPNTIAFDLATRTTPRTSRYVCVCWCLCRIIWHVIDERNSLHLTFSNKCVRFVI